MLKPLADLGENTVSVSHEAGAILSSNILHLSAAWMPDMRSAPLLITHYPRFGTGFQAASDTIPLIRVAACC